jgi:retinol dehydrogenase-12
MGDLGGRTFLVTGATSGIGRATALALAGRGATLFIACRSPAKAQPVMGELAARADGPAVRLLTLDLGDLASVRACAAAFLASGSPLHALINNAGLAGQRGLTASGFELAFGTNHVGTFLLTSLLTERLRESAPARIVNVASDAHYGAKGIDFEAVRRPTSSRTGFPEYRVSKLANVLHAQELGRRLAGSGVSAYSLHPGVIASDVWRSVPWPIRPLIKLRMRSPAEGAQTTLYCATSGEVAGESGLYYEHSRVKPTDPVATPELGAQLWERSASWTSG